MHKIEQAIQVFLEGIDNRTPEEFETIINEFGENCKKALRECLLSKRSEEPFKLRMSNIGKPLRQLMLEKLYGRPAMDAQQRLRMTYGYIWESFLFFLLKAAGLNIETDKFVKLDVAYDSDKTAKVNGRLDLKIDGEIYDIKSASPWSYDNKFVTFDKMEQDDAFGYCGQALGYSIADKSYFGGWIVIDKADGRIKVVPIPKDKYREIARKYLDDFKLKFRALANNLTQKDIDTIAPCIGELDETFNKRPTGNKFLSKSCEFCSNKYKCHPNLIRKEDVNSKAQKKSWKYYTKLEVLNG